jgi:threonine dehydrogenase-like Zn-dependent dehydrogenase
VKALTDGKWCERVIECTGLQWPLDLAGELTAERGRLVIAGYHQDGLRQVNLQLWNWRGIDVINAHERDPQAYVDGMKRAVDADDQGVLDPSRCTRTSCRWTGWARRWSSRAPGPTAS